MANLREIDIQWVTPSGSGKVTVLNFLTDATVAVQRASIQTFMNAIKGVLSNQTTWNVANDGREFDSETGTLTNAWADSSNLAGAGTAAEQPTPDANMALIRWQTGLVLSGRFLQGRSFIPGLALSTAVLGNVNAGARGALQTGADGLAAAANKFVVWQRPKRDPIDHSIIRIGGFGEVGSGTVWEEFAVLRRRRG